MLDGIPYSSATARYLGVCPGRNHFIEVQGTSMFVVAAGGIYIV